MKYFIFAILFIYLLISLNGWADSNESRKQILKELQELKDKYTETGNDLNECMETGNRVFNN